MVVTAFAIVVTVVEVCVISVVVEVAEMIKLRMFIPDKLQVVTYLSTSLMSASQFVSPLLRTQSTSKHVKLKRASDFWYTSM